MQDEPAPDFNGLLDSWDKDDRLLFVQGRSQLDPRQIIPDGR
jgi:hypothetical protein